MTIEDSGKDSSRQNRSHSIRAYVSDLICNASSDEDFDAKKILEENPEIARHRSLVLDLAYEEFCRLQEKGMSVRQTSFAQRFPEYEESLMRVLQVHQYLESAEEKKEKPKSEYPKPGDRFGGYRLVELIGRGSFAFVFIAEQLNVADRRVVLKITRNALEEIATLGSLDHPNIVQIFTVESNIDGFTAICMPLISQVTLFDVIGELHGFGERPETAEDFTEALEVCINEREHFVLDRKKLPYRKNARFVDVVLQVGLDIATALAYSHQQKTLHCDIKPTNILVTPGGKSMLFDFNLSTPKNSKTGRIGGTLPYMPPEQLQALLDSNFDFEATVSVDLFSFGVTLYQFLTGKLPFGDIPETATQKDSAKLLLERQKETEISFDGVSGLNPSLKRLIRQCLAFEPADRPGSANEVVKKLETESRLVKRTRRWMILHPIKSGLIASFLLMFIPISIFGGHYFVYELPRQLAIEDLEKGKKAALDGDFRQAISCFQKSLKNASRDSELRYEILSRLAIVFARRFKPQDANRIMEIINDDFPMREENNARIELAVLAAGEQITNKEFHRGRRLHDILIKDMSRKPWDENNYLSLSIRYQLAQEIEHFQHFRIQFENVLKDQPDQFGANYNMYRLIRNQNPKKEMIDDKFLKNSIATYGDNEYLVSCLFRNLVSQINNKDENELAFVKLAKRYADCGGERFVVEKRFLNKIKDLNIRNRIFAQVKDIVYQPKERDLFVFYGIEDPVSYMFR